MTSRTLSLLADVSTLILATTLYRQRNPQKFLLGKIGLIYSLLRRLTFVSDTIPARIVRKFAEIGMLGFWFYAVSRSYPFVLGIPASWTGKNRNTGQLHPLAKMLLGPFQIVERYQYRQVCVDLTSDPQKKSPLNKYDLVWANNEGDSLYVGMWPGLNDTENFPEKVDVIFDLTNEESEPYWVREGREYVCFPVWDQYLPEDKEAFIKHVEHVARQRGSIYIHCMFGVSRSALACICVLVKKGVFATYQEAMKALKAVRPMIQLREEHLEFLEDVIPRLRPNN